ncbi:flagellar hook-basal body complex protein FliE [Rariglobus hedericola]|uniref:Flagellar hook-basal body complex protein FliE n=1 Tax=Rariglobus hedericola TaxID=2597822 RepID=A0A556QPU2_9BACT|nr:flagellar hook-basal body complex protein FliE [Rariglobus hedericola]TSJ78660.1 flagellar hook-basal body complex protein FliE [Rariglobus hedericola]
MALIGSIGNLPSAFIQRLPGAGGAEAPTQILRPDAPAGTSGAAPADFGSVFDKMVSAVDTKQREASDITRKVLMGDSDQLHQSVIAMQEAGVAFQLMVETRNKVVESYQELMRMPV